MEDLAPAFSTPDSQQPPLELTELKNRVARLEKRLGNWPPTQPGTSNARGESSVADTSGEVSVADTLKALQGKVSGVTSSWNLVTQLLGMAGFAESVFEVVYILTHQEGLRQFEKFFFFLLAATELFGEGLAFFTLLWSCRSIPRKPSVVDRIQQFVGIVRVLVRDPIHNYLSLDSSVFPDKQYVYASLFTAIYVSGAVPFLVWTICVPLWPFFDHADDRSLKWWICGSSWVVSAFILAIGGVLHSSALSTKNRFRVCAYVVMYSFNKTVAMVLLVSRGDRLAEDAVGQTLRGLQLAELLSAVNIIWRIFLDKHYAATVASSGYAIWAPVLCRCITTENSRGRFTKEEGVEGCTNLLCYACCPCLSCAMACLYVASCLNDCCCGVAGFLSCCQRPAQPTGRVSGVDMAV